MLTITTFTDGLEKMRNKKGIVISSRVHPGETGASYRLFSWIECRSQIA